MTISNKKFLVLVIFALIQGCSKIDDFMLGKDNTAKPTELEQIDSKMKLAADWSVPIGKASKTSAFLKLKPVIQGNIIYTASNKGAVQALDKSTGKIIWTKQLPTDIISGPSIGNGLIAVGTGSASVIVLKQDDGKEVWQAKVSGDSLSKPVISHNQLVVKTINGNLYAFNLQTGEKLWTVDHGTPSLVLKASSSPVIMDRLALVGFSDGKLDAIDLQSGTVVWQRSIAFPSGTSDVERLVDIDADPIVRGDTIFLASYQGFIGALSMTDGQFKWHKTASTYKNLAIDSNTLYMTDSNDVVWAFDRQNGQIKWKQEGLKARVLTEPVLMQGKLVVGDKSGYLHVLSTQSGEVLARTQLSGSIDIAPSIADKHIYVMTANGKLNRLTVS